MDTSPSLLFHHVSFPNALEVLSKAEQYPFFEDLLHASSKAAHIFYGCLSALSHLPLFFLFQFTCSPRHVIQYIFVGAHYTDIGIFMEVFL